MNVANKFNRQIEDWLEAADGDEDALADQIVEWIEVATPSEIQQMAEYVAKELLSDNDNGPEED
jgi:hypothetical protein